MRIIVLAKVFIIFASHYFKFKWIELTRFAIQEVAIMTNHKINEISRMIIDYFKPAISGICLIALIIKTG